MKRLLLITAVLLATVIPAVSAAADTPTATGPGGLWSLYPMGTATKSTPPATGQVASSPARATAAPTNATATVTAAADAPDSNWWIVAAFTLAALAVVATIVPRAGR